MKLNQLDTEKRNPASMEIDTKKTMDILSIINQEDQTVALSVQKCLPEIGRLIDEITPRMQEGGRVIYIGAGTSGRLGVLDASECPPTYGVSPELIQGLIAGGYPALLKAKEGAEDDPELAKNDLKAIDLKPQDTVIGLAASGRTPYVLGGLQYAKSIGALTGAVSCTHQAQISQAADVAIEAITGPEVVTGSTRMKAGTAQKMILNMISTTLMIRAGKVYQNLMVDVQPTNEKLVNRALRIIQEATGADEQEAKSAFEQSHHSVKTAICMILSKASYDECEKILEEEKGNVSAVIRRLR